MDKDAEKRISRRRRNRIDAFSLIFQIPFVKDIEQENVMNETAALYIANFGSDSIDETFVLNRFFGVIRYMKEIDAVISENTANWSLDRLHKADLAALRLAIFELNYAENMPRGAAVNEAVELAKVFGAKESPSFVNALLGKVAGYDDEDGQPKT